MADPAQIFETFAHREATGKFTLKLPAGCYFPRQTALLGRVSALRYHQPSGAGHFHTLQEFDSEPPYLLADKDNRLWIYDRLGRLQAGTIERIDYEADKGEGDDIIYEHKFSDPYPKLITGRKCKSRLGRLAGGRYYIDSRGIVD